MIRLLHDRIRQSVKCLVFISLHRNGRHIRQLRNITTILWVKRREAWGGLFLFRVVVGDGNQRCGWFIKGMSTHRRQGKFVGSTLQQHHSVPLFDARNECSFLGNMIVNVS